jgi:hypothetical protein
VAPVTPLATKTVVIGGTPKAGGRTNVDLAEALNGAVTGSGVTFNANNYVAVKKTVVLVVRGGEGSAAAAVAEANRGGRGGVLSLIAKASTCKPPASVVDEGSLCSALLRLGLLTEAHAAAVQRALDASASGAAARAEERERINIWEVLRHGPKGQYLVGNPHALVGRWPDLYSAAAQAYMRLAGEQPGERTSSKQRVYTVYKREHAQALSDALEAIPGLLNYY